MASSDSDGMIMTQKTHREVKAPTVSARFLADYMAASETAKRSVISGCKYHSLARVFQHDEARLAVGKHIRSGTSDPAALLAKAEELRNRLADSDFDRSQLDVNADYIAQFATVAGLLNLPNAELHAGGKAVAIMLNGVKVNPQIVIRLQRTTKTNKVMVGAAGIRYAKGAPLKEEIALWQSAFLHGFLKSTVPEDEGTSDLKLCLTIDAFTGACFSAPTDAVRCFNNMTAACASIAERWPNIAPPKGAVL
jgi:hypothetical protein